MTYQLTDTVAGTASVADLSGLAFFAPVLAFLAVFAILYAVLINIKILGEYRLGIAFISFVFASIFAISTSFTNWVLNSVAFFGVLLVALFSIMLLGSLVSTDMIPRKFLVWLFAIVMIVVFIASGIHFSTGNIVNYLPGPFYGVGDGVDPDTLFFFDWLYSPPIAGAIGLIIAAVVVSFILIKYN